MEVHQGCQAARDVEGWGVSHAESVLGGKHVPNLLECFPPHILTLSHPCHRLHGLGHGDACRRHLPNLLIHNCPRPWTFTMPCCKLLQRVGNGSRPTRFSSICRSLSSLAAPLRIPRHHSIAHPG